MLGTVLALVVVAAVAAAALNEMDLIRRMVRGDASALREVFQALGGRANAMALRILKDRAEAEDVVQETFVAVWRRAGDFDEKRGSVTSWVATMVRSRAIDRLRERQGAARRQDQLGLLSVAGSSQSPLDAAASREDWARVKKALAALPTEQRTAVELAYFEGLTQQEISTRTGEPLGTIKTRVRLAMAKLAAALEQDAAV